ncbi:MAG: ATP phosphoribosyltransferase regulatory subunit, partial [bacterium]
IKLKEFLSKYFNELSADSQRRFEKNPLRILDTKDSRDIEILKDAPILFDHLADETKSYFEKVLNALKSMNIKYEIDYRLVRGIDYYSSTVFEFKSEALGSQNTVIAGGRYDNLVEQLGGKPTPAIGFSTGFERLTMILESNKFEFPNEETIKLFIATIGEVSKAYALKLVNELRSSGIRCETDFLNRSVKSQMKEANKLNAEFVFVMGDDELKTNSGNLKRMSDGSEIKIESLDNLKANLK